MTTETTSPPYESVDPRAWYPAVREAVPLEQACREYLVAVRFPDDLDVDDPRLPEAERRVMECYANLAVAATAELAADITPVALGRAVASEVLQHAEPQHAAGPGDAEAMRWYYDGERDWLRPPLLSSACESYLAARERLDALSPGDAGFQEAESAELAAITRICVSAVANLAEDVTPFEMGRIAVRAGGDVDRGESRVRRNR